jgi:hypothetical protein
MPGDRESGILDDAGKPLPLIDRAIYSLEKESIPRWNKFLQGYYDSSGISSDAFDQAIQIDSQGDPILTDAMREQGISLLTSVEPSIFYIGFNMLDPVIGGDSQRTRLLRRAISIAVDFEEFISILRMDAVWWRRARSRRDFRPSRRRVGDQSIRLRMASRARGAPQSRRGADPDGAGRLSGRGGSGDRTHAHDPL